MLKSKNTFSYTVDPHQEKHQSYEVLLDTILNEIKQDESCIATQMEDEGTGTVTYISVEHKKIYLENMKLERNGAQNIGKKRVPRNEVHPKC